MFYRKAIILLNTLKHLRLAQVFFYIYYFLLKKIGWYTKMSPGNEVAFCSQIPIAAPGVYSGNSFSKDGTFSFLNRSHRFEGNIDWNFSQFGKLWTYNLNYFDFLFQKGFTAEEGISLIRDFAANRNIKDGLEPYCISVRTIQWIKFLCLHGIADDRVNTVLRSHILLLRSRIEYHLLANHVLENAFALTVASVYFRDDKLYMQAKDLLLSQLKEQILEDGAHYERSPMYQLILVNRLLDLINVLVHCSWTLVSRDFLKRVRYIASIMIGWLSEVQVYDQIPAFQDCTNIIHYSLKDIESYADRLGILRQSVTLGPSNYRKLVVEEYTLIADVGSPAPSYQPGHAHACALSFVLYHRNVPLIVDPGISTYEVGEQRLREKSTRYHNTVEIRGVSQSEIWGSFRMGRRAYVNLAEDSKNKIDAEHNGYRNFSVQHRRLFCAEPEEIVIQDNLVGATHDESGIACLHFHPDREIYIENDEIWVDNWVRITLVGHKQFCFEDYNFANDFNVLSVAKKVLIRFCGQLVVSFKTGLNVKV